MNWQTTRRPPEGLVRGSLGSGSKAPSFHVSLPTNAPQAPALGGPCPTPGSSEAMPKDSTHQALSLWTFPASLQITPHCPPGLRNHRGKHCFGGITRPKQQATPDPCRGCRPNLVCPKKTDQDSILALSNSATCLLRTLRPWEGCRKLNAVGRAGEEIVSTQKCPSGLFPDCRSLGQEEMEAGRHLLFL